MLAQGKVGFRKIRLARRYQIAVRDLKELLR